MKKEKTMSDNVNPYSAGTPNVPPTDPAPQQAPEVPPYQQPAYQPYPTEPEQPKKGFPKIILIIGLLLIVGAAAFFGIRALGGGKPLEKTATGIKKTVEAMEKADTYAVVRNASETGSINVNVDLSKLTDVIGMGIELPVTVNATVYSDLKNSKFAYELDAQVKNKSIVNGTIIGSPDEIAVACDAILGKTGYSLDLKNLAKNLPGSFLDPDTDSDYALPEELYDWLVGLKNGPIAPMKELMEKYKSVFESAAKVLLESLEKNAEVTKDSETISIGDADVKTTAVTVKLNGKQAAAVAADVLKWAKSDKDLRNMLENIIDLYAPVIEAESYTDPEDFIDEFYDSIDDALDELADVDKDDLDLTAVFYLNNSNGQLVRAEFTSKSDDGKNVVSFEGGPDWKSPTYIAFSQKDSYSKQTVTYTVEENSKSQYSAKIKVKDDRETTMTLSIDWDKSSGDLRISSSDLGLKLTGNLTKGSKETVIVLKKLEYSYFSIKDLGTTITLTENAKLPTISKTTEILSLDEDGLEDLIDDVQDALMDLMGAVQDAMN